MRENDNTFEALVKLANKSTEKKINRHTNGYSSLRVLNIPCGMIYRSDSLRLVLPLCISIKSLITSQFMQSKDLETVIY
jgi:hypothetical protein